MSDAIHEFIRAQNAQAIMDEYAYSPRLEMVFEIIDLRDRLEQAEGLLRDCKEPIGIISELTVLSGPLRIDDSIKRRSDRAKQIRTRIDAFLRGD